MMDEYTVTFSGGAVKDMMEYEVSVEVVVSVTTDIL